MKTKPYACIGGEFIFSGHKWTRFLQNKSGYNRVPTKRLPDFPKLDSVYKYLIPKCTSTK